ncbi:MAG: hypothetical protein H7831_14040 [Magnetococcus sp. WYHC-3]
MIITATLPGTEETLSAEVRDMDEQALHVLVREHASDEQIRRRLDNLPLSAEAKVLLYRFSQYSMNVGGTLLRIGKKILEVVLMLVDQFPVTTVGVLLAALLTLLIASIPWIGQFLAGFLGPVLMIFGLGAGVWKDINRDHRALADAIQRGVEIFSPLKVA